MSKNRELDTWYTISNSKDSKITAMEMKALQQKEQNSISPYTTHIPLQRLQLTLFPDIDFV